MMWFTMQAPRYFGREEDRLAILQFWLDVHQSGRPKTPTWYVREFLKRSDYYWLE